MATGVDAGVSDVLYSTRPTGLRGVGERVMSELEEQAKGRSFTDDGRERRSQQRHNGTHREELSTRIDIVEDEIVMLDAGRGREKATEYELSLMRRVDDYRRELMAAEIIYILRQKSVVAVHQLLLELSVDPSWEQLKLAIQDLVEKNRIDFRENEDDPFVSRLYLR